MGLEGGGVKMTPREQHHFINMLRAVFGQAPIPYTEPERPEDEDWLPHFTQFARSKRKPPNDYVVYRKREYAQEWLRRL